MMATISTVPGILILTFSSWPLPVWTGPALVCTVPVSSGPVTVVLRGEPNWIVFGNPAAAQVLTLPGTNVARSSDAEARRLICPNAPGAKTSESAATTAVAATIAAAREPRRFRPSWAESDEAIRGMYT